MRAFLGLVFVASLALPAYSADEVVISAEPAAAYDWSGLYVGGHAGYSKGDGRVTDLFCDGVTPGRCVESDPGSPFFGLPGTWASHIDSGALIGGFHVGYNHQFDGGLVLGAESDIEFGRTYDGEFFYGENFGSPYPFADDDALGEIELKVSGSARVRAGYAVDRWLPFATAGVAFARYEANYSEPDNANAPRSGSGSFVGWTAGGGVDYAITDRIILGVEYRYTDFGSDDFNLTNSALDNEAWDYRASLETHDVRFRASLKF